METTFALIKPDCAGTNDREEIIRELLQAGFRITALRTIETPTDGDVTAHLADLKAKNPEAYSRNHKYLLGGPLTALRIEGGNAVEELRILVGATDPSRAKQGTLRQMFGKDTIEKATQEGRGLRNAIHAADSLESAKREIAIWMPDL